MSESRDPHAAGFFVRRVSRADFAEGMAEHPRTKSRRHRRIFVHEADLDPDPFAGPVAARARRPSSAITARSTRGSIAVPETDASTTPTRHRSGSGGSGGATSRRRPSQQLLDLGLELVGSDAHAASAYDAAAQGIILLKNDRKHLPLSLEQGLTVAVIGPHGKRVILSRSACWPSR